MNKRVIVVLLFLCLQFSAVAGAPRNLITPRSTNSFSDILTEYLSPITVSKVDSSDEPMFSVKWVWIPPEPLRFVDLADLDGDGSYEILGQTTSYAFLIRSPDNVTVFYNESELRARMSPVESGVRPLVLHFAALQLASADLDRDGKDEVVLLSGQFGAIFDNSLELLATLDLFDALDEAGAPENWSIGLCVHGPPAFIDVDCDELLEIIVPAYPCLFVFDDYLHNFTFLKVLPSLNEIVRISIEGILFTGTPIPTDFDRDGHIEVVITGWYVSSHELQTVLLGIDIANGTIDMCIRILNATAGPIHLWPKLSKISVIYAGDSLLLFSLSRGNWIYARKNITDAVVYECPLDYEGFGPEFSFVDYDHDGEYEVIIDARNYSREDPSRFCKFAVDLNGTVIRLTPPEFRPFAPMADVAIGDVDGDLYPDIVTGIGDYVWVISGRNLSTIAAIDVFEDYYPFAADIYYCFIADVDGDELAEIVAFARAFIAVIDTRGCGSPWPHYRCDFWSSCLADHDDDLLPDYLEPYLGLDPTNPDTDCDGLPDGYEVYVSKTDPLRSDDTQPPSVVDAWVEVRDTSVLIRANVTDNVRVACVVFVIKTNVTSANLTIEAIRVGGLYTAEIPRPSVPTLLCVLVVAWDPSYNVGQREFTFMIPAPGGKAQHRTPMLLLVVTFLVGLAVGVTGTLVAEFIRRRSA